MSASGPKRRLRVLLLIDYARTVGGAERFVQGLATHLPRERIEPWVCSTRSGDADAVAALAAAGVPHVELGRVSTWHAHRFARLVALIRRERFDVLHAHLFGSNLWGTLLGRACGVPVILAHEHTWSFEDNRARTWIDGRVIGRLATRCVAVSCVDRERMIALERVPAEKVIVMPVAHVPHSTATRGGVRSELGLEPGTPVVGVASVFRRQKALDVLLEAHARVRTEIHDAQLVIAGDGWPAQRAELERRIDHLGIRSSVHLLGWRDDIDAILAGVDVGAMSSDYEGMPLFALECMAAGIPLVATAVGGLPEIIEDGRSGLLVPPRDPEALAAGLRRVLMDRELGRRLASKAADRYHEFRIESVAGRFADLYEQLMAGAP